MLLNSNLIRKTTVAELINYNLKPHNNLNSKGHAVLGTVETRQDMVEQRQAMVGNLGQGGHF